MKENFVTYEQALALKELGFDEPCISKFEENYLCQDEGFDVCNEDTWLTNSKLHYHKKYCAAPLKQQVFRWFTSRYNLASYCLQTNLDGRSYYSIKKLETDDVIKGYSGFEDSYEKAENECINILIRLVK